MNNIRPYKKDLMKMAIDCWGEEVQLIMSIEEMAELTDKLAKYIRGRDITPKEIIEEIVDVSICMSQIEIIFNKKDMVIPCWYITIEDEKLNRLWNRIERHKNMETKVK